MRLSFPTCGVIATAGLALMLVPTWGREDASPVQKLSFHTGTGKTIAWKDLAGKKATVVAFLSFDCPMSAAYAKPLADLAATYAKNGVAFVGFCPSDDEAAAVAKQAKEHDLGFPVFKDEQLAAAAALGATATPQVFVLDADQVVRYRGLIDNGYSKRLVRNRAVTERHLKDAIDSVLAGRRVAVSKTEPIGCPIALDREPRAAAGGVSYHKDVLPILQAHCQDCHRPGEVGPFSLLTYKQAVKWAGDIKDYTQDRRMPPWKPQGGKEFVGERRLSRRQIETLARWVDGGCPEGNPKDAPPPRPFPDGWALGEPDLVLTVPDDFVLGPTGPDHFRVHVFPTGLTEDRYVVAVDVRPGNRRVVHHAVNYFDATGTARAAQARHQAAEAKSRKPGDVDVGPGFSSGMGLGLQLTPADLLSGRPPFGPLGGWAPGVVPYKLPDGAGFLLPKGTDFVMQLHYHRSGRVERDRTRVGLYFAKKPTDRPLLPFVVPGYFKTDRKVGNGHPAGGLGYIPAGDRHFVARGTWYALEDCTLHTVMPHMHLLGKSVKITMTPPRGKPELLIDVPVWDYNWQENYVLKTPLDVASGTRFEIEAVYNNSADNPNNPHNPPIDVRFGEQTDDEMLFGLFGATKKKPSGRLPFAILQGPIRLGR